MNKKITFPQLAATLAALTSSSEQTAEAFLRELLNLISDTLARGESITIKGLGSFAPGLSDDNPVIWSPDEGLAEAVNRPFAFFEPVVLAAGVNEDMLEQSYQETVDIEKQHPDIPPIPKATTVIPPEIPKIPLQEESQEESPVKAPELPQTTEAETETDQPTEPAMEEAANVAESIATGIDADTDTEHEAEPEAQPETAPETQPEPEPEAEPETQPESQEEYYDNVYTEEHRRFNPWFAFLLGLASGAIIVFAYYFIKDSAYAADGSEVTDSISAPDTIDIKPIESIDSGAYAPTVTAEEVTSDSVIAVSKPIAIDTVTTSRYLTTMSRKYYGDYRFWIYIYLENDSIIKNPNRIKPGTAVKIPHPEKYGIDSNDPQSVKRAETRIAELFADKQH